MARSKKANGKKYRIPAVQKTFAILELFANDNRPRTMSEVSRTLALPVSTTSSLLYTILSCGYLARDEGGHFTLSLKLWGQGSRAHGQTQLQEVANAAMQRLTRETGLTSVLAVQDGDQLVWIDKIDGNREIRLAAQIGRRMHPHHTSSGKAILAYLSGEQVQKIVESAGLPKFTRNTITSVGALKKELAGVRKLGYATDDEETAIGIRGAGAPIFDSNGSVIAAVAVGGPAFDFEPSMKSVILKVQAAAQTISEKLGYNKARL
jgi:DNA-binding IclR family transcriptional regulator